MQQLQNQLVYQARQGGQFSQPSPRREPELKFSGPPHKLYEPEQGQSSHDILNCPANITEQELSQGSPRKGRHQDASVRFYDEEQEKANWQQERYFGQDRPRDDDSVDYRGDVDDPGFRDHREKYQWYNERKISPPLEMRRSRSLSPPRGFGGLLSDLDQVQE